MASTRRYHHTIRSRFCKASRRRGSPENYDPDDLFNEEIGMGGKNWREGQNRRHRGKWQHIGPAHL